MIENTSKCDPQLHYIGMTNASLYDDCGELYITGMEAAGQEHLVASTELPAKGPWDELVKLGFVRGEPVPGDDLFVHADLPVGWRKERTDHSMHTKIVDERGVERVSIFYKAAFYDRRADFHIVNVGRRLANHDVWGDEPIALPDCWTVLTEAEKSDYTTALERDLADNIDNQQYYSGEGLGRHKSQAERIRGLLALVAK